jgi:hypothetical protein
MYSASSSSSLASINAQLPPLPDQGPARLMPAVEGDTVVEQAIITSLFRSIVSGVEAIQIDPTRGALELAHNLLRISSLLMMNKGEGSTAERGGLSPVNALDVAMTEIQVVLARRMAPPVDPAGSINANAETMGTYALKQFQPIIEMVKKIIQQRDAIENEHHTQREAAAVLDMYEAATRMGLSLSLEAKEEAQRRVEACLLSVTQKIHEKV